MTRIRGGVIRALDRAGVLPEALKLRAGVRARWWSALAATRSIRARRRTDVDTTTHRWAETGSNRILCRIESTTTARAAMIDNLTLVVDVLATADIPFFLVPVARRDHFRIGVPIERRQDAWQAFLGSALPPEATIEPSDKPLRSAHPAARPEFGQIGRRLLQSEMWDVYRPITDPTGSAILGDQYACEVEFWSPTTVHEGPLGSDTPPPRPSSSASLAATRRNSVTRTIPRHSMREATVRLGGRTIPAPEFFARTQSADDEWFPIDVVYTWVDDRDPAWVERLGAARASAGRLGGDVATSSRFANRDELRYSLRSLHQYADFVRHVYLVTDQQTPTWLDPDAPGLTIVDHREIFRDDGTLPTFNSHAIESCLHRIDGLADHYLYLNDDVFFGRRVDPAVFFLQSGLSKYFLSKAQIPVEVTDLSVDSAAKNGRELMWQEFRLSPTQKFKHTPHPQRRDVLLEIERRFPDALKQVRNSVFRSRADVSVASSLHHHVGSALGLAVASSLRYDYVQLSGPNLEGRLSRVTDGTWDTFCLNDVATDPARQHAIDQIVRQSLDRAFPWPSPWER